MKSPEQPISQPDLERLFSAERLSTYLAHCGGDFHAAVAMYRVRLGFARCTDRSKESVGSWLCGVGQRERESLMRASMSISLLLGTAAALLMVVAMLASAALLAAACRRSGSISHRVRR